MPSYSTNSQTQFMSNVLAKLRNANQVAQSNNLSSITATNPQANNQPKPQQIETHKTISGKKTGNDHSDYKFWDDALSVNGGTGFIQDENARNVIKGILTPLGTVQDVANEVAYGVTKVGESIVDALVGLAGWIGTWFGADNKWAEDFIAYDASRWCVENLNLNLLDGFSELALGESLGEQSILNELPDDWQEGIRGAGNVVGELIPSIVLAVFTGGSSIGVQVAAQAALAGVSAMGQSVEGSVREGHDLNESLGYGAIKGASSAALTAVMFGAGASVASKGGTTLVDKAANKVFEKTGSVATRVLTKAGIKGATAFVRGSISTMVDPLERQITIDNQAIEKAYGSNQAVMETLQRSADNGLKAAVINSTMSIVQDQVSIHKAGGVEKYGEQLYSRMELDRNPELKKALNDLSKYNDERTKICKKLGSGKIDEQEFVRQMDILDKKYEIAMAKYDNEIDNYSKSIEATRIGESSKADQKYGEQARSNISQGIRDIKENYDFRQSITEQAKTAFKDGKSFQRWKYEFTGTYRGEAEITNDKPVNTSIVVSNGNGATTNMQVTKVGNGITTLPVNTSQITTAVVLASQNKNISIQLPEKYLPALLSKDGNDNQIIVDNKVISTLIKDNPNYTPKDVVNALKTLPKANMSSELKGGQITLVSKSFNNEGKTQYNIFEIEEQSHSIKSMVIADKVPENVIEVNLDNEPIGTPAHIVEGAADMSLERKNSLNSSTNVVKVFKNDVKKVIKDALKDVLGDTKVSFKLPNNKNLGRYLFEKVNDPKVASKAAGEISTALTNFSFSDDKGNSISFEELLSLKGQSLEDYREQLTKDIQKALNSSSKETKISKIAKVFDKNMNTIKDLIAKNKESIKAGGRMRVFTNARNKMRTTTRANLKWDKDTVRYNTKSLMAKPLTSIHSRGDKMSTRGFWENIDEWEANYTDKNELLKVENNPRLPYSEDFRNEMLILKEIMPKQNENGTYPAVNSLALAQATRILDMLEHLDKKASEYDIETNPKGRAIVKATIKEVGGRSDSKVVKFVSKVNDLVSGEIENKGTNIHWSFRNNPTINEYIEESANGYMQAQDYRINRETALAQYKKDIKLKNSFLNKKYTINGIELTSREMGNLYNLFHTPKNVAELKRVGKLVLDRDKNKTNIFEKTTFEELEEFVEKNTPDIIKDYSSHIKNLLNNEEKPEYNKRYVTKNGIDSNSEDDYWASERLGEMQGSARNRMYSKPTFGHSISRVQNNNAFVIKDIEEVYKEYVRGMGIYLYAEDPYDNFVRTMSTKVDYNGSETTTKMVLIKNYGEDAYKTLNTTMEKLGYFPQGDGKKLTLLDKGINYVTNLRVGATLAGWATLKQRASIFTSNVRVTSLANRMAASLKDKNYRKTEGKWQRENLPGLKNRSLSNAVVLGNMVGNNPFGKYSELVNKYAMFALRSMDKWTIGDLALSLPFQVEADFGFKVGTDDNRAMVKQLWTDTLLKQIGSTPLHETTLSNSNSLSRLFFGNFQGAINAYYSGVKDKLYCWMKYKNTDESAIEKRIEETKPLAEEAKKSLDESKKEFERTMGDKNATKEEKKEAEEQYEKDLNDFQDKQADYEDAVNDKKGYQRYKTYGGSTKKVFANLAVGTLLMALALSSVDQIRKWITQKEKLNEFDLGNFMTSVLANSTINQIPVLNTLYGIFAQDYELTNPGMSLVTDMVDLIKGTIESAQSGDWNKTFRNAGWLVANSSGMPIKAVYEIINGFISMFSPETAIKTNNVLYNISSSTATKRFHEASENGREGEAVGYLKTVMEEKVGATSDKVTKELNRLYSIGENAVPKASMVSYVDANGKEITLSDLQKTNFKKTYSKANNLVDKLIKSSYYASLDDNQKATAISYTYNAYYDYAKGNVTGEYSSKVGYVLGKTKGNVDMATTSSALAYIKSLEATKDKTRKELAVKYVNSLKCEKGMKYLILKLAGFGLDDKAKKTLQSYLTGKGMTGKETKEFVK